MTLTGHGWCADPVLSKGTPEVERNIERDTSSADSTVPLTINKADCYNEDLTYTFNINVTNYSTSYTLEVWAGTTACDSQYEGSSSTKPCWQLADSLKVKSGVVQEAVFTPQQLFGFESSSSGQLMDDCESSSSTGARQSFNVYFMFTYSGSVKGTPLVLPVYYDLVGPEAPSDVAVKSAENALKVSWEPLTSEEGDVNYQYYCKENPSSSDASCSVDTTALGGGEGGSGGEGGEGGEGGSSNGGTSSSTVGSAGTAGTSGSSSTSLDGWFYCGHANGITANDGYTKTILDNKTSYAVTVVGVDQYGNLGTPASPACGTPQEVDTFFETYRNQGGLGGGGFCSLERSPASFTSMWAVVLALKTLALRRRRK